MSLTSDIRNRKLGIRKRINIDFAVQRFKLSDVIRLPNTSTDILEDPSASKGPLACTRLNDGTVAVANEDGYVNLLRTNKLANIVHWMAHENAIFDIKTGPDQNKLITASGDASLKIWDVPQKREIFKLETHHSTIKSISIYDRNIIASGSRDGTIKVHDLRLKHPTIIEIRDAHRNSALRKAARKLTKSDPISCVTNVVFDPCYPRIYSAGANDATIKLWDLRRQKAGDTLKRTRSGVALVQHPYHEVHHPTKGIFCGYAHLLVSNSKVFAACSDNKIYCYENFCVDSKPTERLVGLSYDNCLRLAIMDDHLLFSGSKGGDALIWSLQKIQAIKEPIHKLKVDNSDHDLYAIETDSDHLSAILFRDDGQVSKWTMMI